MTYLLSKSLRVYIVNPSPNEQCTGFLCQRTTFDWGTNEYSKCTHSSPILLQDSQIELITDSRYNLDKVIRKLEQC